MDDLTHQRIHFEGVAEHYTNARRSPRHQALKRMMWNKTLCEKVLARLPSDRPVRMLEPMCGTCEGRKILEERLGTEVDYFGFDFAPTMVELARKAYPDAQIVEADVTTFEPDAGAYDLVMIVGSLHHVARHAAHVVTRLSKALAPGGLFIAAEPTNNNPLMKFIRERTYSSNAAFDAETERGFTTKELDEMFEAAGLRPLCKTYPTLLAYALWGNPEAFPALDRGPVGLVRAYTALESLLWSSPIAKYLGFGTFAVYEAPGRT